MKKLLLTWAVPALALTSCLREATLRITVENPSAFDRSAEMVEIPLEAVQARVALKEGQAYVLRKGRRDTLPLQITHDGKLIFQSGVQAGARATYTLSAGAPRTFEPKTYGRFVPERKDDFAWENDRVAFRIYGAALVETDGPSNGLDLWYKRTSRLVIDDWYREDLAGRRSYHQDHGEGLDDYKVGRTLGAGMMAPYADRRLWLNGNFVGHEVLDNGPLRTTFRLTYDDLEVEGERIGESRVFSLDAGSQLTRVTQIYETRKTIPVAAGIVKRDGQDSYSAHRPQSGAATLVYTEPPSASLGNIYVAMVFPDGLDGVTTDACRFIHPLTGKEENPVHVLGVTSCSPNRPVTYYTGYGWSRFGFPSPKDFDTAIQQFAKRLDHPLKVSWR